MVLLVSRNAVTAILQGPTRYAFVRKIYNCVRFLSKISANIVFLKLFFFDQLKFNYLSVRCCFCKLSITSVWQINANPKLLSHLADCIPALDDLHNNVSFELIRKLRSLVLFRSF